MRQCAGGQNGPPGRGGQGVRGAEEAGHGRGGEDEAGGSSLPRCPHQREGALGPWSIDMGALLDCDEYPKTNIKCRFGP